MWYLVSDSNPTTDNTLVSLLQDGDPFALECLYERHHRKLYSLALRIMGDPDNAEEVVQDTFFQLWQKSSQFDSERGSLIGWLLAITRHRAISRIREQKDHVNRESSVEITALPINIGSTVLEQQIARELVSAAFAGLPEAQRNAITLAYFEGFTSEEIASRTQTPLGTIKNRLRCALRTMKGILCNPIASQSINAGYYPVTLGDIVTTEELHSRPCQKRDPRQETDAAELLSSALASSHSQLIDSLLKMLVDLCRAGTGGMSLLETNSDGEKILRWTNLSGKLAKYIGGTTPRNFSPCGVTLDCDSPQLFEYPARYFDYFKKVNVPIVEELVIPFHVGNKTEGAIWIVSHEEGVRFDSEDVRIMKGLAEFAGCAIHMSRAPWTKEL